MPTEMPKRSCGSLEERMARLKTSVATIVKVARVAMSTRTPKPAKIAVLIAVTTVCLVGFQNCGAFNLSNSGVSVQSSQSAQNSEDSQSSQSAQDPRTVINIEPSSSGDDGPAFQDAAIRAKSQSTVVFLRAGAIYHFPPTSLQTTGIRSTLRKAHVIFSGTSGLTVATNCGQTSPCVPATLVFSDPQSAGMYFSNNVNLKLSFLTFDYAQPLQALAKISAVQFDSTTKDLVSFDVDVDSSVDLLSAPYAGAMPLIYGVKTSSDGVHHVSANSLILPPVTATCQWAERLVSPGSFRIYPNGKDPKTCASNILFRFMKQGAAEVVGIKVDSKILFAPRTPGPVNLFRGNTNVSLYNVNYRSGGGIATMWSRNHGSVSISQMSVKPGDSAKQVLSMNGGGIIALSGTASFTIVKSEFDALGDDMINIGRMNSWFSKTDKGVPRNKILAKNEVEGKVFELYDDELQFDYQPGDVLALVDQTTGVIGNWRGKVLSATLDEANFKWTVEVDQPLTNADMPAKMSDQQLTFMNAGDVSIVSNSFSRSRGGCAKPRVNIFKFVGNTATDLPGYCIVGGMDTTWGEAGFVTEAVIRGNYISATEPENVNFHRSGLISFGALIMGGEGSPALAAGNIMSMSNVDISGNTLVNSALSPIFIDNVSTGAVYNNTFYFKPDSPAAKRPVWLVNPADSEVKIGSSTVIFR